MHLHSAMSSDIPELAGAGVSLPVHAAGTTDSFRNLARCLTSYL